MKKPKRSKKTARASKRIEVTAKPVKETMATTKSTKAAARGHSPRRTPDKSSVRQSLRSEGACHDLGATFRSGSGRKAFSRSAQGKVGKRDSSIWNHIRMASHCTKCTTTAAYELVPISAHESKGRRGDYMDEYMVTLKDRKQVAQDTMAF
jgi:hypothetical protein